VTGQPAGEASVLAFQAIRRGALEVAEKPEVMGNRSAGDRLRGQVRRLSRIPVVRHLSRGAPKVSSLPTGLPPLATGRHEAAVPGRARLVAIGASAGGPAAVAAIIAHLPRDCSACVAVVQHVPQGFARPFARFCSGSLAGPEHGFDRYIYFANEESSGTSTFLGTGGLAVAIFDNKAHGLTHLGRFAWENTLAQPSPSGNRVVLMAMEDGPASQDPAQQNSQLYMYVGEKSSRANATVLERNGLVGGTLYVFSAKNKHRNSELAFRLPWQLLVISAGAVAFICLASAVVSIRKVIQLEPAVVFKG
jgi:hypothetical protein